MKFSYDFRVDGHDVDINGIASVTSVMRYIQETANLQHAHFGPTTEELRRSGKAFILSRLALDLTGTLRAQDKIKVTSWLNEAKGFGYTRSTVVTRGDERLAAMCAFWGTIDIESRHPLRVEEIKLGFDTDTEILEVSSPLRFRTKDAQYSELGSYTVSYGDCDENIHLNNTNYPRVFLGFLPNMLGKRVTELTVNYQHEARLGTTFKVLHSEYDGAHLFKTALEDGSIGAEARIVLSDI